MKKKKKLYFKIFYLNILMKKKTMYSGWNMIPTIWNSIVFLCKER